MFAWPARVINAIGDSPAAAPFVSEAWPEVMERSKVSLDARSLERG